MHGWCWEVLPVPDTWLDFLLPSHSESLLAAEEQEYSLPQEAFPLRHEIVDNPSALDHLQDKADSPHVSGNEAETVSLTPVESFSLISISHSLYENRLPSDFFNPIVRDTLLFYAEQGDVQTAVSVLIVLGDRIRKEIDEQTQVDPRKPLSGWLGPEPSLQGWVQPHETQWDPDVVYPKVMGSCLGSGHFCPPALARSALTWGAAPGPWYPACLQGQGGEVALAH